MDNSTVQPHEIANVSAYVRNCINTMDVTSAIRALSGILPDDRRMAFYFEVSAAQTTIGKIAVCLNYVAEVC